MNPWIRWRDDAAHAEPAWRWMAELVAMPALLATPPRPLAEMVEPQSLLSDAMRGKFATLLGPERVKQDLAARASHGSCSACDQLRLRTGDLSRLPDAVIYPRNPDDVQTLLKLCFEADIAVTPFGAGSGLGDLPERGPHSALVTVSLSAMAHLTSVDTMSGLARAEAGITAKELARQLAAQGSMLKGTTSGSLGGFIARNRQVSWLHTVNLATPQGPVSSALSFAPGSGGRFGIITDASFRVGALAAKTEYRGYLFADFAGGLAALREAERQGLDRAGTCLSDGEQTHFYRLLDQIGQHKTFSQLLGDFYRQFRQFDRQAAQLTIGFCGSHAETDATRKRFDILAKRLGALALGKCALPRADHRDILMDRGLSMDMIETSANWSKLPGVYATMRNGLDRAMRAHVPRLGAHGLVLGQICDANYEGAKLRLTMVYPRILGSDVAQAQDIRKKGLNVLAELTEPDNALDVKLWRSIKETLDPTAIVIPRT